MKTKILLICVIAITVFASCDKNNEVVEDNSLKFEFQRSGSWIGLDEKLRITADSTYYSVSYRDLHTLELINYETTIKTSKEQWDYLVNIFDLETFTKIQNGHCRACVDGFDEIFSVTQNSEVYSFSNGNDDEHYKQMQDFFDTILMQANSFF